MMKPALAVVVARLESGRWPGGWEFYDLEIENGETNRAATEAAAKFTNALGNSVTASIGGGKVETLMAILLAWRGPMLRSK